VLNCRRDSDAPVNAAILSKVHHEPARYRDVENAIGSTHAGVGRRRSLKSLPVTF